MLNVSQAARGLQVAQNDSPSTLEALANVALIDAEKCAAIGDMSVSWWNAQVAAGRAPAPAFRLPRCTRWRVADAIAFWRRFAEESAADTSAASRLDGQARRASSAAKIKREAAR